jgi:UDP-N-acetylglucosamine:LPS N-acetylglucosamine transferase
MKILFLQFPLEPAWGGAETHTKLLISGLKDLGHEIFLLTSNRALFEKTKEHTTRSKMIFLGWEPTSPYSLLLSPFTFIWAIFVLLANLLIIRPRVLVCLSLTDKLAGTFLAFCLRIPVIWIEHTRVGRWLTASPLKFPYRLLARVATLVAPSYFLRNQLLQVGVPIDRITVIYP